MNTALFKICFSLTVTFSATSGFGEVHIPIGYKPVSISGEALHPESTNACLAELDSIAFRSFLSNYVSYLSLKSSNVVEVQSRKLAICENSYSAFEYKSCFNSAVTNLENKLKSHSPEYEEKKLAYHLCKGVLHASATIGCVQAVKKFKLGMIREVVLCRGNVPFGQTSFVPAELCFIEERRKTLFSEDRLANGKKLDSIVKKCAIGGGLL